MYNRFFFISTYDSISGKVLSSIINSHPDVSCEISNSAPFLLITDISQPELTNVSLDEYITQNTNPSRKFSGNIQRYSAFEIQHKKLVEKTRQPFNTATLLISPELRINFLLQSWMATQLDAEKVLYNIERKLKSIHTVKHNILNLNKFLYYYDLIAETVRSENLADLTQADNKIFIYALAITIAYDSADIPAPGKKFRFEELLNNFDEFIICLKYLTNNKILINDEFRQKLEFKLTEEKSALDNTYHPRLSTWQTFLLNKFVSSHLHTIYYPHLDKSLAMYYAKEGYSYTVPDVQKHPCYSKLISIQLNSNRPAQIASYFDNIEETADNPSDIEVLVNIDDNDEAMKSLLDSEIPLRKFTLKYIQTPRPKSFCDLWKPINKLLEITNPGSYFLVNISDEMFFDTQGWDTILKKYVGYFPDHIFRLRASRNKFRNYFDRWECSFAQDSIPITTKKWVDIGGDWNPCFGPDSFQQLISFYLAKEGKFSNSNFLRDIPIEEIKFSGDVPSLGIDSAKTWRHTQDHINAMLICQSYKMQLEAKRRAILIKANIIAYANKLESYEVTCDNSRKQINIINQENNQIIESFHYKLSWLAITAINQWRKLSFFSYFGDGKNLRKDYIRSYLRYLKAKHISFRHLHRLSMRIRRMNPDSPPSKFHPR